MFSEITDKPKQLKEPNRNRMGGRNRREAHFRRPHNFIAIRGLTSSFFEKRSDKRKDQCTTCTWKSIRLLIDYLSPYTDLYIDPPNFKTKLQKV